MGLNFKESYFLLTDFCDCPRLCAPVLYSVGGKMILSFRVFGLVWFVVIYSFIVCLFFLFVFTSHLKSIDAKYFVRAVCCEAKFWHRRWGRN